MGTGDCEVHVVGGPRVDDPGGQHASFLVDYDRAPELNGSRHYLLEPYLERTQTVCGGRPYQLYSDLVTSHAAHVACHVLRLSPSPMHTHVFGREGGSTATQHMHITRSVTACEATSGPNIRLVPTTRTISDAIHAGAAEVVALSA